MWLEILGQEKENHGSESSMMVVQVPRDLEGVYSCWYLLGYIEGIDVAGQEV
jgi:hypothetical protein